MEAMGLDETFKGKEEIDGEEYHVEDEDNERRPLKCILDVGLRRTCAGARMWGALKGAVDGGLHIPHSTKSGFSVATSRSIWRCSPRKTPQSTRPTSPSIS